jgi:hypothetical protein
MECGDHHAEYYDACENGDNDGIHVARPFLSSSYYPPYPILKTRLNYG